mmetsp:Transcript_7956/g.11354  ORF Transcript_7956/g.11354 Transcript_7956/m.11354 type:complete len:452 (-) Transcript_7956:29-1384(-)
MRSSCNGNDISSLASSPTDTDSVDSEDAFREMFGIPVDQHITFDTCSDNEEEQNYNRSMEEKWKCVPDIKWEKVSLPKRCSRRLHPPSSCLALVADNVLSNYQCEMLRRLAEANSGERGFKYIKEATHLAPDGSKHTVEIHKPNPHKLAIVDTLHSSEYYDKRDSQSKEMIEKDFGTKLMDDLYCKIHHALIRDKRDKSCFDEPKEAFNIFRERTRCSEPRGLNPRMRILKYDAKDDDRFEPHFDATTFRECVVNNEQQKSLITVLVYLNSGNGEEFDGGETFFLDQYNKITSTTNDSNKKFVTPEVGRILLFEHDLYHYGSPLIHGTKYVMRTDVMFDVEDDCIENDVECSETSPQRYRGEINLTNEVSQRDKSIKDQRSPLLVTELCQQLQMSPKIVDTLHQMDLLQITCESFLSPGITLLRQMLIDAGLSKDDVVELIRVVSNCIRNN